MAKTGPQRYPGASAAYWYGTKYPGSPMESNVIVWHTTEGTSLPDYGGGASAPTLTAVPDFNAKVLRWYQHFDFDVSARALVNKAGGVETNTLNAVQVELVGTCDPTAHKRWARINHLYTPELPDWAIRDLAAFARWAHDKHDVPLNSGLSFKAYPSSYGETSTRMTGAEWNAFKGHCGHQHVPENDHGDPGEFPIDAVLAAAGRTTTPSEEDDMTPEQDARLRRIEDSLAIKPWTYRNKTEDDQAKKKGQRSLDAYAKLTQTHAATVANSAAIKALAGLVGKDVDTDAVITAVQQAIADAVIQVDVDINGQEA